MKNNKRYLTIYEQVREDIITKRYHKGAKLPSKRVMAERMDVSLITVEHAYELLLEEGYIASKEDVLEWELEYAEDLPPEGTYKFKRSDNRLIYVDYDDYYLEKR